MANQQLQKFFLEVLNLIRQRMQACEPVMKSTVEFTLEEATTDFLHGEEQVAFEILVSNLYEVNFPLDEGLYDLLAELGQQLGLVEEDWDVLHELVEEKS